MMALKIMISYLIYFKKKKKNFIIIAKGRFKLISVILIIVNCIYFIENSANLALPFGTVF